jgi:hypothetical protein
MARIAWPDDGKLRPAGRLHEIRPSGSTAQI